MGRRVILIPDAESGGYTAEVPSLPGCVTRGATAEEALNNMREAVDWYIATRHELDLDIPPEDG